MLPVVNDTAAGGRNASMLWDRTVVTPCNNCVYSGKRDTRLVSNIIEQEVLTSENGKSYIRLTIDNIVFIVHHLV